MVFHCLRGQKTAKEAKKAKYAKGKFGKKSKEQRMRKAKKGNVQKCKKGIKSKICKLGIRGKKMQSKKRKTSGSFEHDL